MEKLSFSFSFCFQSLLNYFGVSVKYREEVSPSVSDTFRLDVSECFVAVI